LIRRPLHPHFYNTENKERISRRTEEQKNRRTTKKINIHQLQ